MLIMHRLAAFCQPLPEHTLRRTQAVEFGLNHGLNGINRFLAKLDFQCPRLVFDPVGLFQAQEQEYTNILRCVKP